MNNLLKSKEGFSLLEAMIALGIGAIFLTSVLATWYATTKAWNDEGQLFEVRINIEKAMERIKSDVRLSTDTNILFYPAGSTSYTAISIPRSTPSTSTGLLTMSSGAIVWDKTVIYHVYTPSGQSSELRRTVINSYDSNSTTRQTQLNTVVTGGTYNTGTYTTTTLFKADTVSLTIEPPVPTFDGYSSTTTRSANTSFGSMPLTAGTHTIRFEVTGKNSSSSSYGIGIDSVTLTPSEGAQEAEALLPVYAQYGATAVAEDMSASGTTWGGNYQVNFQSAATGNYVTFSTNYDQWLESNFSNLTFSATKVSGTNPVATLLSREDSNASSGWSASTQTGDGDSSDDTSAAGFSVRTLVQGSYMTAGTMMRIQFTAASNNSLTIGPAYLGVQGTGPNISGSWVTQLYFDNAAVIEGGTDGTGATANPGTATVSPQIPAGYHIWSNWFVYTPSTSSNYLVSMYVVSGSATVWTPSPTTGTTYNYRVSGNQASSTSDWTSMSGYDGTSSVTQTVYAVANIAVWQSSGTATSQVYDTRMTSPAFNQMAWTGSPTSGVSMQARSSANADMSSATDWTSATTTSPKSLTTITAKRYIQWKATLTAASPYTTYPTLDNVKIDWPGATGSVEFSGYYTKKPSYGIFKVLIDGVQPISGLDINVVATRNYRGTPYSYTLTEEQKALNTGK